VKTRFQNVPLKCNLHRYITVGEMVVASDADSMYNMLTDYAASPRIFATVAGTPHALTPPDPLLLIAERPGTHSGSNPRTYQANGCQNG
jgi:hypothetical protein